jgi:S-adenosylmethionine:tRNA ribosyltransferase-isomerase
MHRSRFLYDLPQALIARQPAARRTESRLLTLDGTTGACRDLRFADLPRLLRPGDLLVINDTRVLPARLLGNKETGGRVELLVERLLDERRARVQLRVSKPPAPGSRLHFDGGVVVTVRARGPDGFYEVELAGEDTWTAVLERIGQMPLPPYIDRPAEKADRERYQTVYAREPGAVAAPTAGLHFDEAMLDRLRAQGVEIASITLHVGAGTFQPVRVDEIEEHRMHRERLTVPAATAAAVNRARDEGRRVVAVGTTVVRALESSVLEGRVEARDGETDIFIYPGYRFRAVDALLTNFHLPESTLLMLVCALAGTEPVLAAYRHAVEERYRFFSYGDAMFVTRAAAPG